MAILTEIQKEALKHKCPACGEGELHEVEGNSCDENGEVIENYLWCNNCDLSMDSCGGYTN